MDTHACREWQRRERSDERVSCSLSRFPFASIVAATAALQLDHPDRLTLPQLVIQDHVKMKDLFIQGGSERSDADSS